MCMQISVNEIAVAPSDNCDCVAFQLKNVLKGNRRIETGEHFFTQNLLTVGTLDNLPFVSVPQSSENVAENDVENFLLST